jgi:L-serine dehydratase
MQSLKALYRFGPGPSSSHTMAPRRAAAMFLQDFPGAAVYQVTLYGSLAATGKGHMTERAIIEAFSPHRVDLIWKASEELPHSPNGMRFAALDSSGELIGERDEYSVGGGALMSDNAAGTVYPDKKADDILTHCRNNGESFWEYVQRYEDKDICEFLAQVWAVMCAVIEKGLATQGALPGGLGLARRAASFHRRAMLLRDEFRSEGMVAAYAYAVAEENASGGQVVTAPTCGASGVVPAVLNHLTNEHALGKEDVLRALATAGLFGNIVKHNGSISGAVVGCQGEIGTACSMAAAAATQLLGGTVGQIEYAAEMGLEHHFGLTCDPVAGLVQIPCIERNFHAAARALSCARFALLSDGLHRISFDDAVAVMLETGRLLPGIYKETSMGGLAKIRLRHLSRSDGETETDKRCS